jgi:AraC-like DNA-binding protein
MRQMGRDKPPLITPRSAERLAGMVRVAPAPDLADVVEQHWIVSWDRRGAPAVTSEVLPDPCVNLAVEPAGVLLYGVTSRTSRHVLEGAGAVVGTKFRPGGFSGYLPGPVRALNDRVLPVAEAFGADGERLVRELGAASTTRELVELVTAFLRARRPPPDPQRALVREVVEAMRAAPPGTSVAEVAASAALTPRTLQRLFAAHVGATPKRVLQRFRLQDAADRLASGDRPQPLARLAAELGYFDQAHFTQDFRAATGRLPSAAAG